MATARRLFAQSCRLVVAAGSLDQLPADALPEVAFAGRSNVGKSSLLNALTGRRRLARTSRTPGRTQTLNVYELAGRLRLVDLPGFGYAASARQQALAFAALARAYLKNRASLRRVFLLVDARRGLEPADQDVMALLDRSGVAYQIVLTKTDHLDAAALAAAAQRLASELARHAAAHPSLAATSARAGAGLDALRLELMALARPEAGALLVPLPRLHYKKRP